MSTVLTNGIIIPDNGSRNWGGDLANNWNIIDVNVGYMTDVKNKVTTLENSVAENTANIQINASNISALQTSKQDVIEDLETIRAGASAGATAVQPSVLSDYATKSELSSKANDSDVVHKSGDTIVGDLLGSGSNNLGAPTNKWKSFNGINPGAVSLPDYTQYVSISFAVETLMTMPANGFLNIVLNVENNSYVNVFVNDHSAYIAQSALKPTVGAFIPVSANDTVKIHVSEGSYTGYGQLVLYKNKGNV